MGTFVRNGVRFIVIGTLVGGAALILVEPSRIRALITQTRSNINDAIDSTIADPVALRAQLRNLEAQYPQKIADVQGDLAEVQEQIAQLQREQTVSRRVVQLADADLATMQDLLARAEDARTQAGAAVVKVRFENRSLSTDDAYAKANRISQLRSAYAGRAADIERDMGYLTQQEERLSRLLDQLQTERAQFQTQLWDLDRQVDTIARNDRLIEMMQKRQETLDRYTNRYQAGSLDQITARLADLRSQQEAKLQLLSQDTDAKDYQRQAEFEIDTSGRVEPFPAPEVEVSPSVIEISPDSQLETGKKPKEVVLR